MRKTVALIVIAFLLTACSKPGSKLLEDVSGVWRAQDGAMVIINNTDKGFTFIVGENSIPVKLGAIDNDQGTVNLNVDLVTGKPAIWTIKQIWDKEHKSFHLNFTLHDGTQDELSFVRKVSSDDLAIIESLNTKSNQSSAASAAVTTAAQPAANYPVAAAPATDSDDICHDLDQTVTVNQVDCLDRKFEKADSELNRSYKALMASLSDTQKITLKQEQIKWIKEKEIKCNEAGKEFEGGTMETVLIKDCMVEMTENRISYLSSYSAPPEVLEEAPSVE